MSSEFAPETLTDLTDYYLILDLKPDASPNEIREAYLRSKATYQKDNVALYTLIDAGEREEMLRRIEEAYQVLSNPDRRREYDRLYGQISSPPPPRMPSALADSEPLPAKVISIDRTAPMESFGEDENPLNPPRTDIPPANTTLGSLGSQCSPVTPSAFQKTDAPAPLPSSATQSNAAPVNAALAEFEKEISEQTEWSGAFLRHVREVRGISIEEVTQATKVTKAYVLAIEEENYAKLPAAVFIRGFVSQLARLLKLPHEKVSAGYMARLQQSNPEKFK